MVNKYRYLLLFVLFLLCAWFSALSFAEEVSDPVRNIQALRLKLEKEQSEAEQEKTRLYAHMQKCETFLATLSSAKDQESISLTRQAIEKDKSAIAKIDMRLKEIKLRLALADKAQQYLQEGTGGGIGCSVDTIQGNVYILRQGTNRKIRLVENMQVGPGDKISTEKDSQANLVLIDGSRLNLGPNSKLEILEDNFKTSLTKLLEGKIGVFVAHTKRLLYRRYEMRTPTVVVSVRGTKFDIEVDEQGHTRVFVHEGVVEIKKIIVLHQGDTWIEEE